MIMSDRELDRLSRLWGGIVLEACSEWAKYMQEDGLNASQAASVIQHGVFKVMLDNGVNNKQQRKIIEMCWNNFKDWEDARAAKILGDK